MEKSELMEQLLVGPRQNVSLVPGKGSWNCESASSLRESSGDGHIDGGPSCHRSEEVVEREPEGGGQIVKKR